jgi:transcriptional regulator with GAF, ATPase, and Fis domain
MEQQNLFQQLSEQAATAGFTMRDHTRLVKREFVVAVLQKEDINFNQCRAAKALGLHRNTLGRALKELGIKVKTERDRFISAQAKKAAASIKKGGDSCRKTG